MNIDLKKPIQFVSEQAAKIGWVATVVTDKGPKPYCLLGVGINSGKDTALSLRWTADGKAMDNFIWPGYWDICNVPEKLKVDVWLNVYRNPLSNAVFTTTHNTLVEAAKRAAFNTIGWSAPRLACLHITAEVDEGFGIPPSETGKEQTKC